MTDVRRELEPGLAYHQAGQLEDAQRIYLAVLERFPNHADANHLAGVVAYQLGDHERAVSLISTAIRKNGRQPDYHVNLGNALQAKGDTSRAVSAFRRALKLNGNLAEAHFNLGNALSARGELDQAVASYRSAIQLQPRNPIAHNNLGNALNALGKAQEAVGAYRRALSMAPEYSEARLNLGIVLERAGERDEALGCYEAVVGATGVGLEALLGIGGIHQREGALENAARAYRRILEASPDHVDALVRLGRVLYESGDRQAAEGSLRRALAVAPGSVDATEALASVLCAQRRTDEAVTLLERALAASPDDVRLLHALGAMLEDAGETERAAAAFRRAVEIAPGLPELRFDLGITLEELGDVDEACREYRCALERNPRYAEAHRCLALAVDHVEVGPEIEAMARLYEDPATVDADRAQLGFGLAKAYDDLQQFDLAFAYLETANRLVRAASAYDVSRDLALFERVRAWHASRPAAPLADSRRGPATQPQPIFIVGMPRSGSTLVEQILASHSAVHGAGEIDLLRPLVAPELIGGQLGSGVAPFPERVRDWGEDEMAALGAEYTRRLAMRGASHPFVTDKTLENFVLLGLIHDLFPRARIVHCVRDPMDICFSCYQRYFTGALDFSFDLIDLGRYYRGYDALMRLWRERLGESLLDLPYEALVQDQETQTRRLLSHCGLEWEAQCLRFHDTQRAVRTASRGQVRRPLFSGGVGRWQRYEAHLAALREALSP